MKIYYHRKRNCLAECMGNGPLTGKVDIIEYDAGLHFLVRLHTALSDEEFKEKAKRAGINVAMLSDYYHDPANAPEHLMIMNYSGIHMEKLPEALKRIAEWL